MAYIALHGIIDVEHVDTHIACEVAVDELCVGIMGIAERMQPVGCGGGVSPFHIHQVGESHVIASTEERERQHVALRQTEVQSEVGIVEMERVVAILLRCLQEEVEIRAATGKKK